MGVLDLIDKYYPQNNELGNMSLVHGRSIADKALWVADKHPELDLDTTFLSEAAMLYNLGIFLTHAPGIRCLDKEPYIYHRYLGAELVRGEGFPRYALVCERHAGAGLSLGEIIRQQLPIPHHEMLSASIERQVIRSADKFFSETHLDREESVQDARKSIARYGGEGLRRSSS